MIPHCLATQAALLAILASPATAQDEDAWLREPVCGHHQDVRGFSLDLPSSLCGRRYLHGLQVALGGGDDDRSIVVWAARNASFHTRSRDIAAAEVEGLESDGHSRVRVLARASMHVQGVSAVRWRYTHRSRVEPKERVVDRVAVLRPLRPEPRWSDCYEYSMPLHTTPEHHAAEVEIFEGVLASLAFSEPEV